MNKSIATKALEDLPAHLTRQEFAEYVRASLRSADRLIAAGKVRAVRVGRLVLVPRAEVRRLIENQ